MFNRVLCCLIIASTLYVTGSGQVLAQEQVTLDGVVYRDPMKPFGRVPALTPAATPSSVATNYVVTFVRSGGAEPIAVINAQTVTIGEIVGGATVQDISEDTVTLWVAGETFVVSAFRTSDFRQKAL